MDLTLTGLIEIKLFSYLDDIVINANTVVKHEIKFSNLAERLIQPDKCEFPRPEV